MSTKKNAVTLTKLQADVVKALDHIFTVEAWEIPDSAVEGKLTAKVLDMEKRVAALESKPATQRFDPLMAIENKKVVAKKGGRK